MRVFTLTVVVGILAASPFPTLRAALAADDGVDRGARAPLVRSPDEPHEPRSESPPAVRLLDGKGPEPGAGHAERGAAGVTQGKVGPPKSHAASTTPKTDVQTAEERRLEIEELKREISNLGMVALLASVHVDVPKGPWGGRAASADTQTKGRVVDWAGSVDEGAGGLQLTGTGDEWTSAGGVAQGRVGTVGGGNGLDEIGALDLGHDRVADTHVTRAPRMRFEGGGNRLLPPDVIQRVVRQSFGRFRLCYDGALRTRPALEGSVVVKFTIDGAGAVSTAADVGSDLPDAQVIACIVRGFGDLTFPASREGIVTVVYPLALRAAP